MPRRCSVFGCRSNYDTETERTTTFSLPTDDFRRKLWLHRIPTDLSKLKRPIICIKHFDESCIIREDTVMDRGEMKVFRRVIPKLTENAVPTKFTENPVCHSKSVQNVKRCVNVKEDKLRKTPESSIETKGPFLQQNSPKSHNNSSLLLQGSRKTSGRGKRRLKVLRSPERATADDNSVLPSTSKEFAFVAVKQEPPDYVEPDELADAQIEFEAVKQELWVDPEPGESAATQDSQLVSVKQEPLDESDFNVPEDFVAVKLEPCEDTEVGDSAATQGFDFVSVKQEPLEESDLNVPEDFVAVKLEPCDDTEAATQDLTAREKRKVQTRSRFVASSSRLPNSGDDFLFPEVIVNTESGGDETSVQPSHTQERATAGCGENDEQQTVSRQYTCSSCLCVFSSKYSLTKHVFTHLEGVNAPQHVCQLCGLAVASRRALTEHTRDRGETLHSLWDTIIMEKKLFCSVCREDFKAEGCLRAHMAEHAHDDTLTWRNSAAEPLNECRAHMAEHGHDDTLTWRNSAAELLNECKKCGVSFGTGRALAWHKCPHEMYDCKLCKKYFRTVSRLEKHYLTHGKKRFVCQYCNRSFEKYKRLRLHTNQLHTQNNLYICDICRKGFADRYSLAGHKALHNEQQLFGCGACGKYFLTAEALKKHTSVHSRKNKYNCDVCHKSFTQHANLIQHREQHFPKRPYICIVCSKTFTNFTAIKKHVETHEVKKLYYSDMYGRCVQIEPKSHGEETWNVTKSYTYVDK